MKTINEEVENHKWRNWTTTYEDFEKPQMKKLKIHKWKNWKSTNEKIEKLQMKKLETTNEEFETVPVCEYFVRSQMKKLEIEMKEWQIH